MPERIIQRPNVKHPANHAALANARGVHNQRLRDKILAEPIRHDRERQLAAAAALEAKGNMPGGWRRADRWEAIELAVDAIQFGAFAGNYWLDFRHALASNPTIEQAAWLLCDHKSGLSPSIACAAVAMVIVKMADQQQGDHQGVVKKPLLITDAAKQTGINRGTIYRAAKSGLIPWQEREDGKVEIDRTAFELWASGRKKKKATPLPEIMLTPPPTQSKGYQCPECDGEQKEPGKCAHCGATVSFKRQKRA